MNSGFLRGIFSALLILAFSACSSPPPNPVVNSPAASPDTTRQNTRAAPALLTGSPTPPPPGAPAPAGQEEITLRYTIDRAGIPPLNYTALTLKIFIGSPTAVSAAADGQSIPVTHDPATGYATVDTTAQTLELRLSGAQDSEKLGEYTKTALKDDRQWAWSHGFDDNTMFKEKGISAFDRYGWRGTVYLIGEKISPTRDEGWIIDQADIIELAQKGWGIGNHSWSHKYVKDTGGTGAAKEDILRLQDYLRRALDEAGLTGYHLVSFAAPNFDAEYHPILTGLRGTKAAELLFNESGDRAIIQVDPGASGEAYPAFDPAAPLGRDWRIDMYGSGSEYDLSFRADLEEMVSQLDAEHHFWLNTFTHGVDEKPDDQSIPAFLPWIYETYGPGGADSVWIAPAEEIYSYLLVRDRAKVEFQKALDN